MKALLAASAIAVSSGAFADNGSAEQRQAAADIKAQYSKQKSAQGRAAYRAELLSAVVSEVSPRLPIKYSDAITWNAVKTENSSLVYVYIISDQFSQQLQDPGARANFTDQMKTQADKSVCGDPVMKALTEIKGQVRFEMRNSRNQNVIAPINILSCS